MLFLPRFSGFNSIQTNATTRPVAGSYGRQWTPGINNAKGNWTDILNTEVLTNDTYGILINVNTYSQKVNSLTDIGVDPSGGASSWTVVIPDLLMHGPAAYTSLLSGAYWYFPLFIKAGSSIGVRSQNSSATAGTAVIVVWLFQQPVNPDCIWCGKAVESVGVVSASSQGTAVTPGTTNEGAWTSLGNSAHRCSWWQMGFGSTDATMAALGYHNDLGFGDGSANTREIINNALYVSDASEQLGQALQMPCNVDVPAGSTLYGRSWCSGTPDTGMTMAAYGVAG